MYLKNGHIVARDDMTGEELDENLVKKAMAEELTYFHKMKVYDVVDKKEQQRCGGKIIGTKWVVVNKGDSSNPDIRARLVGKEFRTTSDDSLYAATPPLEALRVVISHAATESKDGSQTRAVMINDVRRAYFYAKATRPIYIKIPRGGWR